MNPALARLEVDRLRRLPLHEADRALCGMHSECWHAIGAVLGLRLPLSGRDKPAIIVGALFLRPQQGRMA